MNFFTNHINFSFQGKVPPPLYTHMYNFTSHYQIRRQCRRTKPSAVAVSSFSAAKHMYLWAQNHDDSPEPALENFFKEGLAETSRFGKSSQFSLDHTCPRRQLASSWLTWQCEQNVFLDKLPQNAVHEKVVLQCHSWHAMYVQYA